jgi:hypothetical protein
MGEMPSSGELVRKHGVALAALLLCAVHVSSFDFRNQPLVTDARYYAYFAWRITEGDVPHLDFFDNKTQLTSFVGALFYAVGDGLGVDPLLAIRAGYLGLTALGGMLGFFAYRLLGGGSGICALLGVLAYCSFAFLGLFPSFGNVPKLLMAVAATATALLVHRRRWFWAGLVGALAFMDWQIGALVWLAAFVSALVFGQRWRSALEVVAGGAAGIAPFLVYFAVNGALGEATTQVIEASLFRGAKVMDQSSLGKRLGFINWTARLACSEQRWLFYASLLGVPVVGWWLRRWRDSEAPTLLLPLAIYHFGVVAFSLTDFQWYGDFFLLLHSAAFFLAVLWIALYRWGDRWIGRENGSALRRALVGVGACLIGLLFARPGPLQPHIELQRVKPVHRGATLADQREVAEAVRDRIEGKRIVFLDHSELLFLMRRANGLPVVFWNRPTWSRYRQSADETRVGTAARVVRSADPDVVVVPHTRPQRKEDPDTGRYRIFWLDYSPVLEGYTAERFSSENDRYQVSVGIR